MTAITRFCSLVLGIVLSCAGHAADPAISPHALQALMAAPDRPLIVDVRTPPEYSAGHVPGAINIAYDRIDDLWPARHVPSDREVVLYCGTGRRAGIAQRSLEALGYTHTRLLDGSFKAWTAAHLPVADSVSGGDKPGN